MSVALPRKAARVRPRVLEIVWLTLVWVLLWGTFTPLSVVGGVVVGVAVIGTFRFPPAEAHLPVRPLRLLGLVGYLAYDMIVSGAEVSWQTPYAGCSPARASGSTSPRAVSCTSRSPPASTRPASICTATTSPTASCGARSRPGSGT